MNISVVIATYNRATLLGATLEQLRQQPYEPGDEVIVVDNGSTDGTPDVVARAASGFPVPLHYRLEATPGKTPALNTGVASATGDILALTDDDVLVAPDWIPTIRQVFENPALALVGGRVDPNWERPAPRWLRIEQHGGYGPMSSPLALLHYGDAQELGARTAVGANMMVRRTVLHALGGFAPHLGRLRGTLLCGEDHEFCQRAVAAGYRCEYRPEVRVRHWVPAERTQLRYHLRWFFWSGVTHALLKNTEATRGGDASALPSYLLRRLVSAPVTAVAHALTGRTAEAAARAMDAAFAIGYIRQRIEDRWNRANPIRRRVSPAPRLATAQRPRPVQPHEIAVAATHTRELS
jgi:GT2 family glycosyltransferase